MSKEQILLVVSVAIAALVIWGNTGQYESVGVSSLAPRGSPALLTPVEVDPGSDLVAKAPDGRAYTRQTRDTERDEMPDIDPPRPLPLEWAVPVPSPGPDAEFWAPLRREIKVVPKPEEPDDPDPGNAGGGGAAVPGAGNGLNILDHGKKPFDPAKVDRVIWDNGREDLAELTPLGDAKGQEKWVILERWPNVSFRVKFLNKDGTRKALMDFGPEGDQPIESLSTVHLATHKLLNRYHERRIRTGVRWNDRAALIGLADWVMETQVDDFSVEAVELAIWTLEKARALGTDLALIRKLGNLYRLAYNLDGELKLYQDYMEAGRTQDTQVLALVGGALLRIGAVDSARQHLEQAAKSGEPGAVLALAECHYAAGDLDEAYDTFAKIRENPTGPQRAHALEGMARVRLRQGNFSEAKALGQAAKSADSASGAARNTLGSALYCSGEFSAAESEWKTASALMGDADTRARSNLGFALAAQGQLEDAVAELQACLDTDPLNYFAPLAGLGQVHQQWNDLTQSNDYFDTALIRKPRDPWILVRRGMTALRDGIPDKALALGKSALDADRSQVDALRLIGLASGRLAEPDHDTAVSYLGRAFQKEPDNMRLAFDLAFAQLEAGRLKEASRLLARLTDVARGPARNDPKLLSLAAYAMFLDKANIDDIVTKLNSAIANAGSPGDKAWAETARGAILKWNQTRIWKDEFLRQAGTTIGNGWRENEAPGPKFSISDNVCLCKGRIDQPGGPARKGATLERDEELHRFISAEVSLRVKQRTDVVFHIYRSPLPTDDGSGRKRRQRGVELGLGIHRTGKMMLYNSNSDGRNKWAEVPVGDYPEDGEFHTIQIVRIDNRKGIFNVLFDGELVNEEPIEIGSLSAQRQALTLGFLVDGDLGAEADFEIDYVRVKRTIGP